MWVGDSLRKEVKLAVNFTLAIALLYCYSWPFAFLCPLLVLHIRYYELTSLPLKQYLGILCVAVSSALVGFLVSLLYPISIPLFLSALMSCIYLSYWWDKQYPNELHTSLRVIAIVLISAITLANSTLSQAITFGLIQSLVIAMLLCLAIDKLFGFIADAHTEHTLISHEIAEEPLSNEWQSLIIFLPAVLLFILFHLPYFYVALISICVLTLTPNLGLIKEHSRQYLIANLFAGLLAIAGYFTYDIIAISVDANWTVALAVSFLFSLLFAKLIYHSRFSEFAHFALSPFALLLVQSDRLGFDIVESYQLRMLCIFIAVIYVYVFVEVIARFKKMMGE